MIKRIMSDWEFEYIAFITLMLILIIPSFLLIAKCTYKRHTAYYYKSEILDVNCGDKFKGEVYKIKNTSHVGTYYQDMKGREIELPEECVIVTLKRLPMKPIEG